MAECLHRAQPVSVANHIKARWSLIERSVTWWLATESGWARSKRSTICSDKLCGGFIIFGQCCPVAFSVAKGRVWNTLSHHVTSATSLSVFRSCLKIRL